MWLWIEFGVLMPNLLLTNIVPYNFYNNESSLKLDICSKVLIPDFIILNIFTRGTLNSQIPTEVSSGYIDGGLETFSKSNRIHFSDSLTF